MKRTMIGGMVIAGIWWCGFLPAAGAADNLESVNKQIAAEEKNIEALDRQYNDALRQKRAIDEKTGKTAPASAAVKTAAPRRAASLPAKSPAGRTAADPVREFRIQVKTEEEKIRQEERLRKITAAKERKAEQDRQREANEQKRAMSAQQRLEAARRAENLRFITAQEKEEAAREQQQRKLEELARRRKVEETRRQALAEQRRLDESRAAAQEERDRAAGIFDRKNPIVADRRQKKVTTALDQLEKMDSWVKENLW